ncbi:ABC transporter substrate-binding protein [Halomonas tibetensis]|uniref:ABC transporter substrate-binding protein n=1 Tax=Halomonas tibetensis TaxID=2259590 RepID=A0ABV7BBP7_9GAMM
MPDPAQLKRLPIVVPALIGIMAPMILMAALMTALTIALMTVPIMALAQQDSASAGTEQNASAGTEQNDSAAVADPDNTAQDAASAELSESSEPSTVVDQPPRVTLTPPEPITPPPLKPLKIMLDWYPGPQHAALLIAQHKGLMERQGLQVTLSTPADPTLPTRLLAAGRIDLAVSRQPLLHLQVDQGLPLIRIGTLVDLPLAGLLLRDDGTMESPAQLAGKRIGYSVEESRELLLPALLKPHGIAIEELELVDVNFSAVIHMVDESLDGVMTPQRLALPRRLGDEGITARLLNLEEHGFPRHEGLILVANRDRLGGQKESLRRLLEALTEATAWSLEHPEEAWALLADIEPTLDTPANQDAWPAMLMRLSARPAALDQGGYRRFEAFLHEQGLLETLTPVDKLAVDLGAP